MNEKNKIVFEFGDIAPQLNEQGKEELKGTMVAAQVCNKPIRHRQGVLDLIVMPTGKMMRGEFLTKEALV